MAKASSEEKSSDGLEIISIGKIYSGPWDKKYWSSSRGKDRYPYPIGYNAVRTRNSITYKMEILEGLKGPLFTISSTDGKSCSGQTPDMAWECFQKKSSSQMKLWHGKRFSCKIDGVEFFGFRNAFVQRLLRELVANVSRTAAQSFPPSSSRNAATETRQQPQCSESTTYTDPLPSRATPRVTGKRSRKGKVINIKSVRVDALQKLCPEEGNHNSDAPKFIEMNGPTNGASDDNYGSYDSPQPLPGPLDLEGVPMKEARLTLSERDSKLQFSNMSGNPKVNDLLSQEPTRVTSSRSYEAVEEAGSSPQNKKFVNKSKFLEAQDRYNKINEDKGEETLISDNLQTVHDAEICAPDSFDPRSDDSSESGTKLSSEAASNVKDMTAPDLVNSEVLVSESHPEDDAGSSIPNSSSEQSDFDTAGQEIAKSMMTVLLPRALPLFKTFSRKRKKNVNSSKELESDDGNNKSGPWNNVPSTVTEPTEMLPFESQKDNMHLSNSHSVVRNVGHMESVVPDSFDNNDSRQHLSSQLALCSDDSEVDRGHFNRDPEANETSRLAVSGNTEDGSAACHAGPNDCGTGLCSGRQIALNQKIQGSDSSKCISHIGCSFSHTEDVCLKSNGNSVYSDIHSGLRNFSLPDSTEDVRTDANLAETKNFVPPQESSLITRSSEISAYEIPVVAAESTMMCTSLAEGVLHIDSKGTCGSKKHANLHCLPASKFSEVRSSNQIPSGGVLPSNVTQEELNDQGIADDNTVSYLHEQTKGNISEFKEGKHGSYSKAQMCLNHNKLVGSYVHPMPISMVLLRTYENEIYICALCGILGQEEKTLFVYKAPMEGENMGSPSFIGHVSLIFPSFEDTFGRDVVLQKSGLQFTPNAKSLVMLNKIKTPYCREANVHCPCGSCKADCYEKNAIKIVQVKGGFVSVVTKLKTSKSVCCILVCEPSFLIAAEDSGKLYLWLMNTSWSAKTEECYLPTSDCIPPCSVELRKIPKSAALILGHNGFGEFCLWDICKRILVSKFSCPSTLIHQFIPVSFCKWQSKVILSADTDMELYVNEIMDSTRKWFSTASENQGVFPTDTEDVAIWLLISSNPDMQYGDPLSELHTDSIGCWRLALLVKNMVIMGSSLDPRAAAVGASVGQGIIGRDDGLVYNWELSTGVNLGSVHHFKGERASCIATNDTGYGAFAITSNGGELRIYLHS